MPVDFPDSSYIHWTKSPKKKYPAEKSYEQQHKKSKKKSPLHSNPYLEDQPKVLPGSAGSPWSQEEDDELVELVDAGYTLKELADHFERTKGSIRARMRRLGLDE
jgi:V8-like Glu-specific endopeptidase